MPEARFSPQALCGAARPRGRRFPEKSNQPVLRAASTGPGSAA